MRERSDTKAKTADHGHWPLKFKIMQKIKLNKSQQSLLMLGNCIYESDGVYYCYLPFYFKSTKDKNTFELIYLNNLPEELKDLIHIYKKDEIIIK